MNESNINEIKYKKLLKNKKNIVKKFIKPYNTICYGCDYKLDGEIKHSDGLNESGIDVYCLDKVIICKECYDILET